MESIKQIISNKKPVIPTTSEEHDDKGVGFIIIPPTILWDDRLTLSEKVVYGRIFGFITKYGYCNSNNKYLMEPLGIGKSTFKNYLSRLYKLEYLRCEIIRSEKGEIVERRIYSTTLVPQEVLPSTPGGTVYCMEGNNTERNILNNVNVTESNNNKTDKKDEKEIEYYARLLADKLNDKSSIAYYKKQCRKYNCSALLRKASEIASTPGVRNPGAVFVHWLQEQEKL